MDALIQKIVTETVNGCDCIDAQSQNQKQFLNMGWNLGSYTALSQVLDVMKPMAGECYTHCSFRHKTSKDGSEYHYTTKINYRNRSVSRTLKRTLESCSTGMIKENTDCRGIGAVDAIQYLNSWAMMKISKDLKKVKHLISIRQGSNSALTWFLDP